MNLLYDVMISFPYSCLCSQESVKLRVGWNNVVNSLFYFIYIVLRVLVLF